MRISLCIGYARYCFVRLQHNNNRQAVLKLVLAALDVVLEGEKKKKNICFKQRYSALIVSELVTCSNRKCPTQMINTDYVSFKR
jgi:hypothetical protein